jgi:hypothetical protein
VKLAALGATAALLAYAHPPLPMDPDGPLVAEKFVSPAGAMHAFLDHATGVVAFGELHQTEKTAGVRSSIARFTDEILPVVAPRAAHLIVETWISTGRCGETEKKVTADVARTTERPAETENEIVRLLRRAKELGVAPHVLDVDCHAYQTLMGAGGAVDYDRLLTLTGQHLGRAIEQALALPRPAERPLVLVYGGALHNDLAPNPALASYSFGPAIDVLTQGNYREVDLYVPELVDTMPALRAERWYAAWRPVRAQSGVTLVRRRPRSAVLLFEDRAVHRKANETWLARTIGLLERADRIEAFAVHPWPVGHPRGGHQKDPLPQLPAGAPAGIAGYAVYAAGKPLTAEFAHRLVAQLVDGATYGPVPVALSFEPSVGYRIWSAGRSVDLVFSFFNDQVEVEFGSRPGPLTQEGVSTAGDIQGARAAFLALAKEALPAVLAVRAIPAAPPP